MRCSLGSFLSSFCKQKSPGSMALQNEMSHYNMNILHNFTNNTLYQICNKHILSGLVIVLYIKRDW